MNGGYIMIDCTGLDLLSETSQTITGLYKKCADAMKTNKPVYAVNLTYGDYGPTTPVAVMLLQNGANQISASSMTLRLDITSADAVTITNYIS